MRHRDFPPLISPEQAAADKLEFERKWKNSASPEELKAERRSRAQLMYSAGVSYTKIGKALGVNKETAHALVDPEWEAQLRAGRREKWRGRKAA